MIERVNVIAGGSSAKKYNLNILCHDNFTIGVNESILLLPVAVGVTMDRTWFESRYDRLSMMPIVVMVREEARLNIMDLPKHFITFKCDRKSSFMTEESDTLNGYNSGICALNCAFQMKPKKICLYGFDCDGSGYWWDYNYPWQPDRGIASEWQLEKWKECLNDSISQIRTTGVEVEVFQ